VKIVLAPLDERPVNTRYPQMIAAIAGVELALPPVEIRGFGRTPADTDAVAAWLRAEARDADGIVASAEYLAWGNLINSRISHDSAMQGLTRLSALQDVACPVSLFALITRVSNADDCVEEPLYWKQYGTRFYKLSQLLHRQGASALEPGEAEALAALQTDLPQEHIADWLIRRERNHAVNLALVNLLARGGLDFLLITSDDTSAWGMPSYEKAWIEGWLACLGSAVAGRTMMHPGADEVGSALVARMLAKQAGKAPRICPVYSHPGGEEITAPYEDRAVRLTVEGQIGACGGTLTHDPAEADILLAVLTPSPVRTEWRESFAESERASREAGYRALFQRMGAWQAQGRLVALGDVAYPNGADPLAMELLLAADSPVSLSALASFGAWNTAGNSLGTTVAQAVALWVAGESADLSAQSIALAHHFLEGWGYQTAVRKIARAKNVERGWHHDPAPDSEEQQAYTCKNIEAGLQTRLARLQERGVGAGLHLVSGSVTLPWKRTFECDFVLTSPPAPQ
jgi:hypothetical protein